MYDAVFCLETAPEYVKKSSSLVQREQIRGKVLHLLVIPAQTLAPDFFNPKSIHTLN
jgi:hypothetical protein